MKDNMEEEEEEDYKKLIMVTLLMAISHRPLLNYTLHIITHRVNFHALISTRDNRAREWRLMEVCPPNHSNWIPPRCTRAEVIRNQSIRN